jgi:hypothetical protein
LPAANPFSTFHRDAAAGTIWAKGTGEGARARQEAHSPSPIHQGISIQFGPSPPSPPSPVWPCAGRMQVTP